MIKFNKPLLVSIVVGIAAGASAQITYYGDYNLQSTGYDANDGTFQWKNLVDNTTVYTFCMSENNVFGGLGTVNYFHGYTVLGNNTQNLSDLNNNALSTTNGHFIGAGNDQNDMGGSGTMDPQKFLDAMYTMEYIENAKGGSIGIGNANTGDNYDQWNDVVHAIELGTYTGTATDFDALGNYTGQIHTAATTGWNVLYLQQNGSNAGYNGQPQALVYHGNPPVPTPEPVTIALGIAGLAIAVRRRMIAKV